MNYFSASQRESDGRFDYTCSNRRLGTYAVGYCAGWKEYDPDVIPVAFGSTERYQAWVASAQRFREKYHTDGHATSEEACACYRQYLIDHRLVIHDPPEQPEALHRCAVCGEYTAGRGEVDGHSWFLCDEHRTVDTVAQLFPRVGKIWSS